MPQIETHPFEPFLPANGRLLMLGSFPPQPKRWDMPFYYPNRQNDMWRIMGLIFYGQRNAFINADGHFMQPQIERFLYERGIALYDTACAVRRLQDNASDKFLEVVQSTDIDALLAQMPHCTAIATTGQKATDTLCELYAATQPPVGGFSSFNTLNRTMRLYRMPSSSRAYPLALEKKAATYQAMFLSEGML